MFKSNQVTIHMLYCGYMYMFDRILSHCAWPPMCVCVCVHAYTVYSMWCFRTWNRVHSLTSRPSSACCQMLPLVTTHQLNNIRCLGNRL